MEITPTRGSIGSYTPRKYMGRDVTHGGRGSYVVFDGAVQQGAGKRFLPLPHGHGSEKRPLIPKQLLSRAREQQDRRLFRERK
jgi:hypothetical protein